MEGETDGGEEAPPLLLLPSHSVHRLLFTPRFLPIFSSSVVSPPFAALSSISKSCETVFPVSPLPSFLRSRLLQAELTPFGFNESRSLTNRRPKLAVNVSRRTGGKGPSAPADRLGC